jgi:hypothetical protein
LDLEANLQVIKRQTDDNLENGEEYARLIETPYHNMMLKRQVLITKERPTWHMFYHKKWYSVKCGLGVFKEGTITGDNLHGEKCNRLLTQMSGCNIFLSCNLCFRIKEIKTE